MTIDTSKNGNFASNSTLKETWCSNLHERGDLYKDSHWFSLTNERVQPYQHTCGLINLGAVLSLDCCLKNRSIVRMWAKIGDLTTRKS